MNTSELHSLMPPATPVAMPAAAPVDAGERATFVETLRTSFERQSEPGTREEHIKKAANQLVSVAFIKPLLSQMRQSPFKNDMFTGGQGEAIFQEHLDTVLADRITSRTSFSIADAIYRRIAGPSAATGTAATVENHRIRIEG